MLRVGAKVQAKYMATSAGVRCPGDWFAGKITKVNQDGTYNVAYDDGDIENAVLARYIKAADGAQNKRPAEQLPPEAEGSRRARKRPAVERQQPVVPEATKMSDDEDQVVVEPPKNSDSSFTVAPGPPLHRKYSRCFDRIPRPPNGWKGMSLEDTDNGGELPAAEGSSGA